MCETAFQVSVLGAPPLDLGHESKIKQYVKHLGQILTILHKFAHCRSTYPSDESSHPFWPGDQFLLKTWKTQIKWAPTEEDSRPATEVDTGRES